MTFYFELAQELGYTVGRLLSEISSWEIAAWMAFLTLKDEREQEKKRKQNFDTMKQMLGAGNKAATKKWRLKDVLTSNGTAKKSLKRSPG